MSGLSGVQGPFKLLETCIACARLDADADADADAGVLARAEVLLSLLSLLSLLLLLLLLLLLADHLPPLVSPASESQSGEVQFFPPVGPLLPLPMWKIA